LADIFMRRRLANSGYVESSRIGSFVHAAGVGEKRRHDLTNLVALGCDLFGHRGLGSSSSSGRRMANEIGLGANSNE
jgi:hypothetical protein